MWDRLAPAVFVVLLVACVGVPIAIVTFMGTDHAKDRKSTKKDYPDDLFI